MTSKLKTECGAEGHWREPGVTEKSHCHSTWFCGEEPRAHSAFYGQ